MIVLIGAILILFLGDLDVWLPGHFFSYTIYCRWNGQFVRSHISQDLWWDTFLPSEWETYTCHNPPFQLKTISSFWSTRSEQGLHHQAYKHHHRASVQHSILLVLVISAPKPNLFWLQLPYLSVCKDISLNLGIQCLEQQSISSE